MNTCVFIVSLFARIIRFDDVCLRPGAPEEHGTVPEAGNWRPVAHAKRDLEMVPHVRHQIAIRAVYISLFMQKLANKEGRGSRIFVGERHPLFDVDITHGPLQCFRSYGSID